MATTAQIIEIAGASSATRPITTWTDWDRATRNGTSMSIHGSSFPEALSTIGTGQGALNYWKRPAPFGPIGASFIQYPLEIGATSSVRRFRLRLTAFKFAFRVRFWLDPYDAPDWEILVGINADGVSPHMIEAANFVGDSSTRIPNLMPGYATTTPFESGLVVDQQILGSSASSEYLSPVVSLSATASSPAVGPIIGYDEYQLAKPLVIRFGWQDLGW